MNDTLKYALGFAVVVAIFAGSIILNQNANFGGADVAGRDTILKINPNYTPWFQPFWQPKPETESMLFALQAAIGAFVVGYYVGYEKGKGKT